MGVKARELVGEHAERIVELLNRALADEWLAYYQYWIGSKVVKGPMKSAVEAELVQHAADELRHADMLVRRVLELGGVPILNPQRWFELTNCGYDEPTNPVVKEVLRQNLKGERCAVDVYNQIATFTKEVDPITYNLALQIMADELEHEEDLQSLLEDLESMKFLK